MIEQARIVLASAATRGELVEGYHILLESLDRFEPAEAPACRKVLEQKPAAEPCRRLEALLEKQSRERLNPSSERLRTLRDPGEVTDAQLVRFEQRCRQHQPGRIRQRACFPRRDIRVFGCKSLDSLPATVTHRAPPDA